MEKIILTEEQMNSLLDSAARELLTDENRVKVYGAEGLAVGDEFVLTPNAEGILVCGNEFENRGKVRKFLRLNCTGDRANVSVTALLGTSKPRKYFASAGYAPEFAEGYDADKAMAEMWKPEARNEKEIIPILATKYVGAKFICIASVEYTAEFEGEESTVRNYLFKCEMPK